MLHVLDKKEVEEVRSMLSNFQVENFKAFENTGAIDIKPLTFLTGINSAGKSSIIQALLLLKQTLESTPTAALAPGKGRLLEQSLGDNFNDFIFGRPALDDAELVYQLSFTFDPSNDRNIYDDCQAMFESMEQPYPDGELSAKLRIVFSWGSFGHRGRPTVRVSDLDIDLELNQKALVGLQISPTTDGIYGVSFIQDKTAPFLQQIAFSSLEIDGLSSFLPDSLVISSQPTLFETRSIPVSFMRLFRDCFAAVRRDLSKEISYLNSFRKPPSRVYTTGQTSGGMLTPDGSNVAEVLWQLRKEKVKFVHPRDGKKQKSLPEMTDYVLRKVLGLQQTVSVDQVAKDILEIRVRTLGPKSLPVTLADVGLGYNQILPVIVQGLLTPPGGLAIFEQPEIHLHPNVQARLIVFFVGLIRSGRHILVETHSSHMIDSLCLEIAKNRKELEEQVNVLFVHPPDKEHRSARIESVKINRYGEVLNWPSGFMPDTLALRRELLQESIAKHEEDARKPQ
jgi:predicted ATPase